VALERSTSPHFVTALTAETETTGAYDALVPPSSSFHQEFASVGQGIRVQIIVDWVFWFALICALYWVLGSVGRKARKSS
jgi:hypothetical protein